MLRQFFVKQHNSLYNYKGQLNYIRGWPSKKYKQMFTNNNSFRNKPYKFLFSVLLVAIGILSFLVVNTKMPNSSNNGFFRKWIGEITPIKTIDLPPNYRYIYGISPKNIYIGGQQLDKVLILDKNLKITNTIHLSVKGNKLLTTSYFIEIDSPSIYLYAHNFGAIAYGNIDSNKLTVSKTPFPLFTKAVHISPLGIILRSFDTTQSIQTFQKFNLETKKVINQENIVSQKLIDGGFSTDGQLNYDEFSNNIIYVEYYCNKFYCLDTNLNLKYIGKTIDTTNTNPVTVSPMFKNGKGTIVPTNAITTINENSFVDKGLLFIISSLKADNEKMATFKKNTSIDIYRIKNGKYLGSVLIPNIIRKKINYIIFKDDVLYIINGSMLYTFRLNISDL